MKDDLPKAITKFRNLHGQLTSLAAIETGDSRRALVDLRRELAIAMHTLEQVGPPEVAASRLPTAEAVAEEFRQRFAQMRSRIAMHQTKWPAVLLDQALVEYRASAREMHKSIDEFLAWADALVRRMTYS